MQKESSIIVIKAWYVPEHELGRQPLVSGPRPRRAVAAQDAACREDEANHERDERAEDEPVGVAPRRIDAAFARVVARDAKKDHLDDPCDERDEERERRDEGHEDGARTMVGGAAEAEEGGEAGEAGGCGEGRQPGGIWRLTAKGGLPMGIRTRTYVRL